MLRCRDIPEVASRYLDREAGFRERVRIGMHLAVCRHCRTYVSGLAAVGPLVAASLRRGDEASQKGKGGQ